MRIANIAHQTYVPWKLITRRAPLTELVTESCSDHPTTTRDTPVAPRLLRAILLDVCRSSGAQRILPTLFALVVVQRAIGSLSALRFVVDALNAH